MKSLRILHVANRAEKKDGRAFYALPYKINNGLTRNNHHVLWFSDRDIAKASAPLHITKLGKHRCNERLLKVCRNFEPDLVILAHADLISNETLTAIRTQHPDVALAQYNIDILEIKRNAELVRQRADVVDAQFVTTAGDILKTVAGKTTTTAFIPNPVDSSIDTHVCHTHETSAIDIFFAGQKSDFCDPEDIRNRIHELPSRMPDRVIRIHESIWGSRYIAELGQSKIGLNLSSRGAVSGSGNGSSLYLYSSDRISQYLGNGLLTFSPSCFSLAELYGEDRIVEFESLDELADKAEYYLTHSAERREIAANAHRFTHAEHNSTLVAKYIIETTLGMDHSHAYAWPTEKHYA